MRIARWRAIALAAIALAGCVDRDRDARADTAQTEVHAAEHASGAHHAAPASAPAGDVGDVGEPADMSIYNIASEWTDASGATRPLASLRGRVRVVALVYTSCAYACPAVVSDMKRIEAALPGTGFVLVSIDPARDTPERLREFAAGSLLSPDRWTLLTGSDDDLLELAAVLGVRYRRVADDDFMHSNVLTVLDAEGRIIHRQLGLGRVDETIAVLRRELEA